MPIWYFLVELDGRGDMTDQSKPAWFVRTAPR